MTGRDLIIYILENNLEDQEIYKDGKLIGFLTVDEAALKFNVGSETIKIWYAIDILKGIKIKDEIYILDKKYEMLSKGAE